jgi:hypothetical protein
MIPFAVIGLLKDCSYPRKRDVSYVFGVTAVLNNLTTGTVCV